MPQKGLVNKVEQAADKLWYPSFITSSNVTWRPATGFPTKQEAIDAAKDIENTEITYSPGRRQFKPYVHPLS